MDEELEAFRKALMSLPVSYERACEEYELQYDAYKAGHRDALHAAAGLVMKHFTGDKL